MKERKREAGEPDYKENQGSSDFWKSKEENISNKRE